MSRSLTAITILLLCWLAAPIAAVVTNYSGAFYVSEVSAPATPPSGLVAVYAKSDGLLYSKDDAGTETVVTGVRVRGQMEV